MTSLFSYFAVHRVLRTFRPKVSLCFDKGSFTIKTVENWTELAEVMKLRHEVFHREFLGKRLPLSMDFDRYDSLGDHLIIVDRSSDRLGRSGEGSAVPGQVVGCYRLISSEHSRDFYSASEFNISEFLSLPGTKLEMSRACIHRDYRDGVVISLLWRGLVQYIQAVKAEYLFGCASIRTMDPLEVASIYSYLQANGFLSETIQAVPVPAYHMPGVHYPTPSAVQAEQVEKGKSLIPPLLNSYLRAGAKVCGVPALDVSFECIDFLTVLKMKQLTRTFDRKYHPGETPQET